MNLEEKERERIARKEREKTNVMKNIENRKRNFFFVSA